LGNLFCQGLARGIQFPPGARHFFGQRGLRLAYQGAGLFAGFPQGRVALRQVGVSIRLALAVDLLPGRLKGRFVLARFDFGCRNLFVRPRQGAHRQLLALFQDGRQRAEEYPFENEKKQSYQEDGGYGLKEQVPELVERVSHLKS
jgi:hypothetical protein